MPKKRIKIAGHWYKLDAPWNNKTAAKKRAKSRRIVYNVRIKPCSVKGKKAYCTYERKK